MDQLHVSYGADLKQFPEINFLLKFADFIFAMAAFSPSPSRAW